MCLIRNFVIFAVFLLTHSAIYAKFIPTIYKREEAD